MQDILRDLKYFEPIKNDDYVTVKMPVAMKLYNALLTLKIYAYEDTYMISDDGDAFYNANEDASYYYDLYNKKSGKPNYNIMLKDDKFYKVYPNNYNINVALNEFVRFFVYLDDFVRDNYIVEWFYGIE